MSTGVAQPTAPAERAAKRWTYEEYYRLTPESHAERYEIDDGELVPMASPNLSHQECVLNLCILMRQYVIAHDLGRVFVSPFDVIFEKYNTAQPDVMFVSKARAEIVQERGIFGAPDVVVEVTSPSSTRRDWQEKADKYLRFGVQEYWLVNPTERSVEVRIWRADHWAVHSLARETGTAESLLLPGFTVDLAQVFAA
jgi:Uma2 family endonuclease